MPIVKTFDLQDFKREFELYNRRDQFSNQALELIFNYLNQDDYTFQMDVIGFCCEFSERSCQDILQDYDVYADDNMTNEELAEQAREYLHDNTSLVGEYINNTDETVFIFVAF